MAQRFKANDLREMIRSIVRDELREGVAQMVSDVLSERFLRQLAEVAVSRPRGVGDTMHIQGDDYREELAPTPLENSEEWPFQKHPMKHDDSVDEGEARTGPLDSIFFEGTKPLKEDDRILEERVERAVSSPEGQNTIEVWRKLSRGMEERAMATRPMQAPMTQEEAERRLAEKRKALEVKPS